MFCSKCGEKNVDEAKFCMKCGAPLGAGAPAGSGQGAGNAPSISQQAESFFNSIGATTKKTFEKSVSDDAPKPLAFLYEKLNCKDVQARKKVLFIVLGVVGFLVFVLPGALMIKGCVSGIKRDIEAQRSLWKDNDDDLDKDLKELKRGFEELDRGIKELDSNFDKEMKKALRANSRKLTEQDFERITREAIKEAESEVKEYENYDERQALEAIKNMPSPFD